MKCGEHFYELSSTKFASTKYFFRESHTVAQPFGSPHVLPLIGDTCCRIHRTVTDAEQTLAAFFFGSTQIRKRHSET